MTTALFVRIQNAIVTAREDRGAAMAEYGLLLALVALAAIGILALFGGAIVDVFTEAETTLSGGGDAPAEG